MEQSMWSHLPLLVRSNSKDSVEYILQLLWRTRNTGLDSADRRIVHQMLQLDPDSDLDSLLVCLRSLIRRCVCEEVSREGIAKLFPSEVSPELQRLLTLLLQKFQREWRQDVADDQGSLPRLKTMSCDMVNEDHDLATSIAVINFKLQSERESQTKESEVKFQVAKDTLQTMIKSISSIRDQMALVDEASNGQLQKDSNVA